MVSPRRSSFGLQNFRFAQTQVISVISWIWFMGLENHCAAPLADKSASAHLGRKLTIAPNSVIDGKGIGHRSGCDGLGGASTIGLCRDGGCSCADLAASSAACALARAASATRDPPPPGQRRYGPDTVCQHQQPPRAASTISATHRRGVAMTPWPSASQPVQPARQPAVSQPAEAADTATGGTRVTAFKRCCVAAAGWLAGQAGSQQAVQALLQSPGALDVLTGVMKQARSDWEMTPYQEDGQCSAMWTPINCAWLKSR